MKRIANYRSGDRAEALGIVLMQSFCAVASVPRQEDFGLVDAVATLLRRDGRLLYAEDSFLIQFKSRTENVIEYREERFAALLAQDLSLFVAHVNLKAAEIKLYNVGAALWHPNCIDATGLVVYLDSVPSRFDEGVLHVSLGNPVLVWTTAELASRDFEQKSYKVMKQWLELDRRSRRYRRLGMQMEIQWKTNDAPSPGAIWMKWNPSRGAQPLNELVPAIQMIAGAAMSDSTLAEPVFRIMAWMRSHGTDPDVSGVFGGLLSITSSRQELSAALDEHQEADIAVRFVDIQTASNGFSFWLHSANREQQVSLKQYEGSIADLRIKGFSVEVAPDSPQTVTIGVGSPWFDQQKHEVIGVDDGVLLLRRVQSSIQNCPEK